MLLRHGADVNARDKNWQTPLHVAAANNSVKCAEYLIPLLANVNISDRSGRTALHHAAFNGHIEVRHTHALTRKALLTMLPHPNKLRSIPFVYINHVIADDNLAPRQRFQHQCV